MKKIITIMFVLALCISIFTGCGKSADNAGNSNQVSSEGTKTAEKTSGDSDNDYFTWDGDTITGLTDSGLQQTELVIPSSAKKIGDSAFMYDSALTSITFENGLEEIGESAFYGDNFTEVSFPSSLKKIDFNAFNRCGELKSITFSVGIEEIDENAFGLCDSLVKIELPEGLTNIGNGAFSPCPYVQDLYLPASLENISSSTFGFNDGANVYVKKGSWADSHFAEFVDTNPANDALIYVKNYY